MDVSQDFTDSPRTPYYFSADLAVSIFLWMVVDYLDLSTYPFK